MKREINMRRGGEGHTEKQHTKNEGAKMSTDERINTDPFGMWTGVPTDDKYEKPVQDADDL
ncbi:MAG: hypothetical protein IKA64_07710 [Clostridia bacterium]|nr:hypothetical protein [Clostridia bacterium]